MNQNDDSTPVPPRPGEPAATPAGPPSPRRQLSAQAKIALGLAGAITLALLFWPRSKPERKFEDGYLIDDKGDSVALAKELAPATLVHFWATWCPPCRQEIPSLLAFTTEVGDARVKLVLVAVADERDRAVFFVGNPRYPVLFDPVWDVARRFRTGQLPETHLVLDGKLAATFVGAADWRDSVARRTVLARLDERAAKTGTPNR